MKGNLSEKSIRKITASIRFVIDILFIVFALIKASSGFTESASPEINHSLKMIIMSAAGIDMLFAAGDLFVPFIFRIHFVLNIIVTIMAFLITAAVSDGIKGLIVTVLLVLPFTFYTLRTALIYKNAQNELIELMKQKQNPGQNSEE